MTAIKNIFAYEIIDSRSFPTIEGRLTLDNGIQVTASVPSGTSIGKYEALELRDSDPKRFNGMGVLKAISYVNDLIGPKLVGVSPTKQADIDLWLKKADGTANKTMLGANTTLVISILLTKAAAAIENAPLFKYVNSLYKSIFKSEIPIERIPSPLFNIINGGKHANNSLEFQEFHLIPSSLFNFSKAYQMAVEVFHELKKVLIYRNANISVGEEGGFTPNFTTNLDAIEVLQETVIQKGLKPGIDVFFGLDAAPAFFYKDERYFIKDKPHPLKVGEYIDFIKTLVKNYSFLYIEDAINEDDWANWVLMKSSLPNNLYIVGDDLLTTNKERLEKAIKMKACTTILVKPNQIGTITETLEVIDLARKNNFNYVVSHRSGETNDSFIADFAVGVQSDFVKFGAPSRGERVAKYNRLWQIEREEFKQ